MAGYPKSLGKENERCICSGQINEIDGFVFEHTLDSRSSSSGSPICLIDNKCVVGIHKQGHKYRPVNFGTFLGIILDKLQNNESNEIIEQNKEHEFHFKNIKSLGKINNEENIQSVLLLDEKYVSGKDKFLIVKSQSQISFYFLESRKLKFKVRLNSKNIEDNGSDDAFEHYLIEDKLEVIDNKYYKTFHPNSFLLITKYYKIEIDLNKNNGKIIDSIDNYFDTFKSKNIYDTIYSAEFISNLDVFSTGKIKEKYFICFLNKSLQLKKKVETFLAIERTFEINGKYFITYFYSRGCSTSNVFDINNDYQQIYEKRCCHLGNLTTIDNPKIHIEGMVILLFYSAIITIGQ